MRLLFIGDIVGRSGREAVLGKLDNLIYSKKIDLSIANGENASGGLGMNPSAYRELSSAGIEFFTMGNHTFSKSEIIPLIKDGENILCPANIKGGCQGKPYAVIYTKSGIKVGIINLLGSVFMDDICEGNPFTIAKELVEEVKKHTNIILIDFHAEATSEKKALGYYLDGEVSCVLGTHTHTQTADAQILPGGTAFITDVGMTGPEHSVLGMKAEIAVERFVTGNKRRYEQSRDISHLRAVIVDIDENTGLSESIETISL